MNAVQLRQPRDLLGKRIMGHASDAALLTFDLYAEAAGIDAGGVQVDGSMGGMGSAVGQEPKINQEITSWAVEYSTVPVLVKLTPNTGDILEPGEAAVRGGADGISLINTIKSIIGVDLNRLVPNPRVGNASSNGGYCGPAVKPIALHMVAALSRDAEFKIPISGIGGISNWRDAAEFISLGATSVQVCTAVMHYGYRIVEAANVKKPIPRINGSKQRNHAQALPAGRKVETASNNGNPQPMVVMRAAISCQPMRSMM